MHELDARRGSASFTKFVGSHQHTSFVHDGTQLETLLRSAFQRFSNAMSNILITNCH